MWSIFRRFGLEYCDLPTMIRNVSVFLRVLTINVDSNYTSRIPIFFYVITITCMASYVYVYVVSVVWFLTIRSPETGDLPTAMVVLSLGVTSEIGILKLIVMLISAKTVRRIVAEHLKWYNLIDHRTRFSKNLLKWLRAVKKRAMFIWILLMWNALAYICMPMFQPGRHFTEDLFVIYGLEPMLESPNYEIAMFLSGICVLFVCYASCNVSVFIIIIVGNTEAQVLSLSEELDHLWSDAIHEYFLNTAELDIEVMFALLHNSVMVMNEEAKREINTWIKRRLAQIIHTHARNVELLCRFKDVFRLSIAIGFVILIVGLIAELLGGLENTFLQIPFSISLVAIDCWTGQRLMDASETFMRAVYGCKWENFDSQNKKIVLTMLQNSQRTLTLSAGGMAVLSFSCLMSILRSTYSSYTTLSSMIKKSD